MSSQKIVPDARIELGTTLSLNICQTRFIFFKDIFVTSSDKIVVFLFCPYSITEL